MARINIEDSLYTDPRFQAIERKLPRFVAKGAFLEIVKCAQKFWCDKNGQKLIPKDVWKINEWPQEFLDFGMVLERPDGYYLAGSEEHFSWLVAKRKNSEKGGRSTKIKYLAQPKEGRTTADDMPTLGPPTPTLTPTLTLFNKSVVVSTCIEEPEKTKKINPAANFQNSFRPEIVLFRNEIEKYGIDLNPSLKRILPKIAEEFEFSVDKFKTWSSLLVAGKSFQTISDKQAKTRYFIQALRKEVGL